MEVVAKLPAAEQRESELKIILKAIGAFRRGNRGVTLPTEWDGFFAMTNKTSSGFLLGAPECKFKAFRIEDMTDGMSTTAAYSESCNGWAYTSVPNPGNDKFSD